MASCILSKYLLSINWLLFDCHKGNRRVVGMSQMNLVSHFHFQLRCRPQTVIMGERINKPWGGLLVSWTSKKPLHCTSLALRLYRSSSDRIMITSQKKKLFFSRVSTIYFTGFEQQATCIPTVHKRSHWAVSIRGETWWQHILHFSTFNDGWEQPAKYRFGWVVAGEFW